MYVKGSSLQTFVRPNGGGLKSQGKGKLLPNVQTKINRKPDGKGKQIAEVTNVIKGQK